MIVMDGSAHSHRSTRTAISAAVPSTSDDGDIGYTPGADDVALDDQRNDASFFEASPLFKRVGGSSRGLVVSYLTVVRDTGRSACKVIIHTSSLDHHR